MNEPDWRVSDRTKYLSEGEQRLLQMRQNGEEVFDRQGRPRVALGIGPESELARAINGRPRRQWVTSDAISPTDFRRMYEAVALANCNGWVLNTFVTVAWKVAGFTWDGTAHEYHERFLENAAAWFNYQRKTFGMTDLPFAAIWVKEVGQTLGLHSHFLFHVPQELRVKFRDWALKAAHKIVDAPPFDYRSSKRPDGHRLIHVSPNFLTSTDDQWRVFKYMMKALDPEWVISFPSTEPHRKHLIAEFAGVKTAPQGSVEGPRVGRTNDLGPAALRRMHAAIGLGNIWPRFALDDDELRYDSSFLRNGELQRQLQSIPEL